MEYLLEREVFGRGKVLLTGEYALLKGAKGLVLPSTLGQRFKLYKRMGRQPVPGEVEWISCDSNRKVWFKASFNLTKGKLHTGLTDNVDIAQVLVQMLEKMCSYSATFRHSLETSSYRIESDMSFDRSWGLGSSSTLFYFLGIWSGIDPFFLSRHLSNGSGYDVVAAGKNSPFIFSLGQDNSYNERDSNFNPPFKSSAYLVSLGKKVISTRSIQEFEKKLITKELSTVIEDLDSLTEQIEKSHSWESWVQCIEEHEKIISKISGKKRIQEQLFFDFHGIIKSLGAWGGDLCLACTQKDQTYVNRYFSKKNYSVIGSLANLVHYPNKPD